MTSALIPQLAVVNGHPTTNSLDVAEAFGKRHDDVLRQIRKLLRQLPADHVRNFTETVCERENPSGGAPIKSPAYRLTRDSFTLLAMGFTGPRALKFKLAYIDAFNAMEAALTQPRAQLPRPARPAYMREPWFVLLCQQASLMQHRALARAIGIHESTLGQVLNGTGKYGAGLASTARIAAKVLRIFRALVQPRQLVLL